MTRKDGVLRIRRSCTRPSRRILSTLTMTNARSANRLNHRLTELPCSSISLQQSGRASTESSESARRRGPRYRTTDEGLDTGVQTICLASREGTGPPVEKRAKTFYDTGPV